jgi:hypothetical protein
MLDSGYLGQLIAGLFYLIVGAGLLRLSRRTGEKPERHLGFYFFLTGVDYFLFSAAIVFQLGTLGVVCGFIAMVSYAIAVVYLVVFIRGVFRPSETWATWIAAFCSLGLMAGIVGSVLEGAWEGVGIDRPWYWPYFLGYSVPLIWLTFEAFHAYARAKKRLRIGLCEGAVVNRYLLWGCFGAFQVLACAGVIIVALDSITDNVVSGWSDILLTGTEMASIGALWLAFFPPAAYLSWLTDSPAEG